MARLIEWLQGLLRPLGMSGLTLDLAVGACLAAMALSAVPLLGWAIGRIRQLIYKGLIQALGEGPAFAIMNWLTFPGVMAHELAHAFVAKLCGARIDEVRLFRPAGDSLGYVRFTCRGKPGRMALQAAASSCAPVFMGIFTIQLLAMLAAAFPGYWQVRLIAYHAAFSTVCHMTMSRQDLASYKKGCLRIFACLTAVGFVLSYMAGKGTLV